MLTTASPPPTPPRRSLLIYNNNIMQSSSMQSTTPVDGGADVGMFPLDDEDADTNNRASTSLPSSSSLLLDVPVDIEELRDFAATHSHGWSRLDKEVVLDYEARFFFLAAPSSSHAAVIPISGPSSPGESHRPSSGRGTASGVVLVAGPSGRTATSTFSAAGGVLEKARELASTLRERTFKSSKIEPVQQQQQAERSESAQQQSIPRPSSSAAAVSLSSSKQKFLIGWVKGYFHDNPSDLGRGFFDDKKAGFLPRWASAARNKASDAASSHHAAGAGAGGGSEPRGVEHRSARVAAGEGALQVPPPQLAAQNNIIEENIFEPLVLERDGDRALLVVTHKRLREDRREVVELINLYEFLEDPDKEVVIFFKSVDEKALSERSDAVVKTLNDRRIKVMARDFDIVAGTHSGCLFLVSYGSRSTR